MNENFKYLSASQCVSAITGEMSAIAKKKGGSVTYAFRSIDEVMDNLNPLLYEYGCAISQTVEVKCENVFVSKNGDNRKLSTSLVTVTVEIVKEITGDKPYEFIRTSHKMQGTAYSDDYGDKSATQAQSIAYKYAIIFGFCIKTKDMVDGDGVAIDHTGVTKTTQPTNTQPPAAPPATPPAPKPEPLWKNVKKFADFVGIVINSPIAPSKDPKDKDKGIFVLKYCENPSADLKVQKGVFFKATKEEVATYYAIHANVLLQQGILMPVEG